MNKICISKTMIMLIILVLRWRSLLIKLETVESEPEGGVEVKSTCRFKKLLRLITFIKLQKFQVMLSGGLAVKDINLVLK